MTLTLTITLTLTLILTERAVRSTRELGRNGTVSKSCASREGGTVFALAQPRGRWGTLDASVTDSVTPRPA